MGTGTGKRHVALACPPQTVHGCAGGSVPPSGCRVPGAGRADWRASSHRGGWAAPCLRLKDQGIDLADLLGKVCTKVCTCPPRFYGVACGCLKCEFKLGKFGQFHGWWYLN